MSSDGERLRQQVDRAQDEGLDLTRNIRDIAIETHGIARDTADQVIQQGEQLDNVEMRLEGMNADLKDADKNLREIEKCCGLCYCCGGRPKDFTKRKEYKKVYGSTDDDTPVTTQPMGRRQGAQDGQYVERVLGDEREAEMNENLKITDQALDQLMGMATDMGDELSKQNKQLDRINKKAEFQDRNISDFNRRIKNQL
jgi:hypothetical protein